MTGARNFLRVVYSASAVVPATPRWSVEEQCQIKLLFNQGKNARIFYQSVDVPKGDQLNTYFIGLTGAERPEVFVRFSKYNAPLRGGRYGILFQEMYSDGYAPGRPKVSHDFPDICDQVRRRIEDPRGFFGNLPVYRNHLKPDF